MADGVRRDESGDFGDLGQSEGFGMTGHATVAGLNLSFLVRGHINVAAATGQALPEYPPPRDYEQMVRQHALTTLAGAEALEAAFARDLPALRLRAITDFDIGSTAGPGALPAAIAAIIFGDDPLGRIADLIGVAQGAREFLAWVEEKGGYVEVVDDGAAMLIAATVLHDSFGETDLTLLFIQPIRPLVYDWEGEHEGYLVGFRNSDTVFEVPIAMDGTPGDAIKVPAAIFAARRQANHDEVSLPDAE